MTIIGHVCVYEYHFTINHKYARITRVVHILEQLFILSNRVKEMEMHNIR